jgi:TonB family protein
MPRRLYSGLFWIVLCSQGRAFAQCHPPHYREGAIFANSDSVFVQSISIPLQDFNPSKLVCLATSLGERYSDYRYITVNIFSSHDASRQSIYTQEYTREDSETLAQMHARYIFDPDKYEDYVEIMPTGAGPSAVSSGPFSTRIDLPAETTPHCKLEINNRCLIALEFPGYPGEALKRRASGTVTLAATITRSGKVDHVRVVKAETIPANEAVKNLSSWRLEPGPREEVIHITYSYAIDGSLRHEDGVQVHWDLPNAVSITSPAE